jgi:hypothetical protein
MTKDTQNSPPAKPPSRLAWLWKTLAIVVILGGALVAADFFRTAGHDRDSEPGGAAASGTAYRALPSPGKETPGDVPGRANTEASLRRIMAGLVLGAIDDDSPFKNPANKDPEEREKTVADFLKLPFNDLHENAPPDVAPPGAQVLASFANPGGEGETMVLLRIKDKVVPAISTLYAMYTAAGWKAPELQGAQASMLAARQTDQGWLIRFVQPGRERVVYARQRSEADETLIAVYDSPH